ncbi:MAG: GNAT family N-acetyltransferase [Verrucomicrobia bacterium]|nr:GNAT family N-acetyltransferase [Verrucomicrobiota bacterium]
MSQTDEADIRYTFLTDAPYLKDWLQMEEVQRWFPISQEKEIEDAAQCWVGFSRYNSSLTATIDNVPCGIGTLFLMPYKKVAHHCLFKMVVEPKHQRRGIGRALLKNLKHLAKNYFRLELMHIEVFEGNPFIHLLKEFDFQEFARQEKFVKDKDRYLSRILYQSYL